MFYFKLPYGVNFSSGTTEIMETFVPVVTSFFSFFFFCVDLVISSKWKLGGLIFFRFPLIDLFFFSSREISGMLWIDCFAAVS